MAEARDLKFCMRTDMRALTETVEQKVGIRGSGVGSRDLLLTSATHYIYHKQLKLVSPACAVHSMQPLPDYFGLLLSV